MSLINVERIYKNYVTYPKANNFREYLKVLFGRNKIIINAVNDISFKVEEGEIVGLIGPNGAGKSTLIKMMTGILVPSDGVIEIDNIVPYYNRKAFVKNIGVVFGQRSQLWWDLPIIDSFELMKDVYKIPNSDYEKNLYLFSETFELKELMDRPVRQLSLGQRMRAEIALSFLHNPKIIFLDEPTIGLDVIAKDKIRSIIKNLNRERKTTIIITTHDMSDIEELCKRIIVIDKGKLIYDGEIIRIKELYNQQKVLKVEFKDITMVNIPNVNILLDQGKIKKLSFYVNEISTEEVINNLMSCGKIADLEIQGTPIEDIIKEIYSGKSDQLVCSI